MFSHFRKLTYTLPKSFITPRYFSSNPKEYIVPNRERMNVFADNAVGMLSRILATFHYNQVTCTNVATKLLSLKRDGEQRALFTIDFEGSENDPRLQKILKELNLYSNATIDHEIPEVPWFPTKTKDLDLMGNVLMNNEMEDVGKDHPGFKDQVYKRRRDDIAQNTKGYEMGGKIPTLDYTDAENKTWEHIYSKLRPLQQKYMCDSFNKAFDKMERAGILRKDRIPQLQDLSAFLQKETNFRLKPVTGILSQREFLNSLALRTFCCTQYIRHHSVPEYTPEPDVIHEVIGHVAMFADPDFCDLSQEIGLLSLGNTPENLKKLGDLYWYTVEFGVCKEGDQVKGYGAGLASSINEIENFASGKPKFKPLNPFVELDQNYPIQTVQPKYYVAESFKDAGDMLIRYGELLPKPFKAYYNYNTASVEVDRKVKLCDVDEAPTES